MSHVPLLLCHFSTPVNHLRSFDHFLRYGEMVTEPANAAPLDRRATAGPRAVRLRKPSWKDPRLLIGVVVVLLSVAGVVALVAAQDRTVAVYAADRTLSTGDSVTADDVRVVHAQLPDIAQRYVSADAELPEGMLVSRLVAEGELLPVDALADEDPEGRRAVTVEVEHELARAVTAGRTVDIWAATGVREQNDSGGAQELAAGAEVLQVRESSSAFGAQQRTVVEVLIQPEELESVVDAQSSGAPITVVPADQGSGGS